MRWLVVIVACLSVGCPPEVVNPPPRGPDVVALFADPDTLILEVGESATIAMTGVDENGDDVDVTGRVAFTSQDEDLAEVDADGVVTAFAVGETEIIASIGLVRTEIPLRVVASGPPTALAYDTPLLLIVGDDEELLPRSEGGFIRAYAVTPDLPRGLVLDPVTGAIRGTPTVAQPLTVYTITGSNDDGSVDASLALEIQCIRGRAPPFDDDPPDPNFVDENDDGIDGMACGPVFVSLAGNDANEGMLDSPLLTLGAAIALADSLDPKRPIYVSAGTYAGPLALVGGVSIIGGYDIAFGRSAAGVARIEGGRIAISAVDVDVEITLELLEIVADDAFFPGDASIGLLVQNAARVAVRDVTIQSGRGADGEDGENGIDGDDGAPGTIGEDGCENSTGLCTFCEEPLVGDGPFSFLINGNGGDGGRPGLGPQDGFDGQNGEGGALGGARGLFGFNGDFIAGLDGQDGPDGAAGANGVGGDADGDGTPGGDGANGQGAGGDGGTAGTRGGGSFAVVVENAPFVCASSTLVAGNGGNGGDGGVGGTGGRGGVGAAGGAGFDGSGPGGRGGDGGAGGRGGDGGGGGGGSSAALLVDEDANASLDACTLLAGNAGQGGRAGGIGEIASPGTSSDRRAGTLP